MSTTSGQTIAPAGLLSLEPTHYGPLVHVSVFAHEVGIAAGWMRADACVSGFCQWTREQHPRTGVAFLEPKRRGLRSPFGRLTYLALRTTPSRVCLLSSLPWLTYHILESAANANRRAGPRSAPHMTCISIMAGD